MKQSCHIMLTLGAALAASLLITACTPASPFSASGTSGPIIVVIEPAPNTTTTQGRTVVVRASVKDPKGIKQVVLRVDGQATYSQAAITGSVTEQTVDIYWTPNAVGPYVIQVAAQNRQDVWGESESRTVTVVGPFARETVIATFLETATPTVTPTPTDTPTPTLTPTPTCVPHGKGWHPPCAPPHPPVQPPHPAPAPSAPSSPANLAITGVHSDGFDFTWVDTSNNEQGFRLYRVNDDNTRQEVALFPANVESRGKRELGCGTSYRFHLVSFNERGESWPSNEVQGKTGPCG